MNKKNSSPSSQVNTFVRHVSEHLANELFKTTKECTRIEFKIGSYADGTEKGGGGFCKDALGAHFERSLKKYFSA